MPKMLYNGKEYSSLQFNQNGNFSYDEVLIGTWIDGKPLYRKMIDFGELPNTTIKTVAHNIPDADIIYIDSGNSFFFLETLLDFFYPFSHNGIIFYKCSKNDIQVQTNYNFADYKGFICLNYTKTTDKAK